MKFHEQFIIYDLVKRENLPAAAMGPEAFYRAHMMEMKSEYNRTKNRHFITAYNQACSELMWHEAGRPYFKVYPNLLPMFMRTKLSVPGKYLHSPFPQFLIRLPINHGCKELTVRENELQTVLVTEVSGEETIPLQEPVAHSHMFIVWMNFGEMYEGVPYYTYQVIKFRKDQTIEQALADQRTPDRIDKETLTYGLDIGIETINNVIRLVVSTCFLATGADRIVEPDVLNSDLQRYIEAKQRKNNDKIEQLKNKAHRRGKKGWTIGREILLPTYSTSGGSGEKTDKHLRYQHQRRGHFHVFHYGPKKSKWKVRWVRQLTVRPDLPPPPTKQRGYKAK